MATGAFVFLALLSCTPLVVQACNLSNTEKFIPECSSLNIDYPQIVFQDINFQLKFPTSTFHGIYVSNVSLFTTNDEYCGRDTFSLGHQCEASHLLSGGPQNNVSFQNVICHTSSMDTSPPLGKVQLILQLSGSINCVVSYTVMWAQSTTLLLIDLNTGMMLVADDGVFVVRNDLAIEVSCSSSSIGPYPSVHIVPYQNVVTRANNVPFIQQEGNRTVSATFFTFPSNYTGLYSCTSVSNYTTSLFLVSHEDVPIIYYPGGNYITSTIGSPLNISAIFITNHQTIDTSTITVVSDATSTPPPYVVTYNNKTFYIIFPSVGTSSSGTYEICFDYTNEASGFGSGDPGLMPNCLGTFHLTVTAVRCYNNTECSGQNVLMTTSINTCCNELNGLSYYDGASTDQCLSCIQPIGYCPDEFSDGVFWPQTKPGGIARVPCTEAGNQFVSGLYSLYVTRKCSESGRWERVGYTNCLLKNAQGISAIMWLKFDTNDLMATNLANEIRNYFANNNISYDSLNAYLHESNSLAVIYIGLPTIGQSEELIQLSTNTEIIAGQTVISRNSGVVIFQPSSTCSCQVEINNPYIVKLCFGGASPPCNCTRTDLCQCKTPFVGNGIYCTVDSDYDLYPNIPLTVCSSNSTETYCIEDNCVDVYNPNQDPTACQTVTDFIGCPFGTDPEWKIQWGNTPINQTDRQPCPGGVETFGSATRTCLPNGTWGIPDILECLPVEYENYLRELDIILNSNVSNEVKLSQTVELVSNLAVSSTQTLPNQSSHLPGALNTTNVLVQNAIDLFYEAINSNETIENISTNTMNLLTIFDNLLNSSQVTGWQALWQASNPRGSDVLLQNAERYGLLLSMVNNQSENLLRRNNIVIKTKQYNISNNGGVTFPQSGDLLDTSFTRRKAYVSIPSELLSERAKQDGVVSVVSILFQNLEDFIPSTLNRSNDSLPGSLIWSGQVSQFSGSTSNRINLTFGVDNYTNVSKYYCVYWNMEKVEWSNDGVTTLDSFVDEDGQTLVNCQSSHLTAFSVLVDVSGSTQGINPTEYKALEVISYIGCAISIACLIITIIFFIAHGKQLFKSVHLFIHLNLAIALLCGYALFAVGVETARSSTGGCVFVAALLQYFFLSSFCWMMCEGIMLYLMLIVVFSSLAKRWYFFLILGWVPPLLPVVVGVAAGYRDYGVRNDAGELLYCWLSVNSGVIWAFVAPMLIIIIINTVFLILALVSLFRAKYGQQKVKKEVVKQDLALSLLKASLVLLPLLGLTWLFGLLSVNQYTSVFAWIFTILNSLQGAGIFFFHVVRSDKVWKHISPQLQRVKSKMSLKTKSYEFPSQSSYSSQKSTLRLTESAIIEKETINHSGGFAKSTTVIVNKEDDVDYYSDTETDDISDRIKVKEKEANENCTTDEIDEDSV